MLEDSNKIWCVTGLPGAGKTTFCRELAESGRFEHLERDQSFLKTWRGMSLEVIDDILGPMDHVCVVQDWFQELAIQATKMRGRLKRLAEIVTLPGFDAGIHNRNLFLNLAAIEDNEELLDAAVNRGEFLDAMVSLLSSVEILDEAVDTASEIDKIVLLDDYELVYADVRRKVRGYLSSKGFEPGLVVVRATGQAISKTDLERAADPNKQFADRSGMNLLDRVHPYREDEGWSRVVIVDRIDDAKPPAVRNFERGLIGFLSG